MYMNFQGANVRIFIIFWAFFYYDPTVNIKSNITVT